MRSNRKTQAQSRAEDRILAITSGAGRRSRTESNGVPDAYRQLLSEASDPAKFEERPRKRRRVGEGSRAQPVNVNDTDDEVFEDVPLLGDTVSRAQTVIDSDQSDHSDFDEWEEIEPVAVQETSEPTQGDLDDVVVEVNATRSTPKRVKRKALTSADRTLALTVHKAHVLLLLFHAHIRNRWCNLKQVETSLRGVLSAKIVGLLNPKSNLVQLRQSESFLEGLKLAVDVWSGRYKVKFFGLHRSKWSQTEELEQVRARIEEDGESLTKAEFIKAARTLSGSQDLGNQLFCALLRAVGVEARLVCSLQPLPPTTVSQKLVTPQKTKAAKPRIYATFEHDDDLSTSDDSRAMSGPLGSASRRRLGQPTFGGPIGNYQHVPTAAPKKKIRKLDYPVFWVEVLNPAYSKWVVVDAIVTESVNRATKIEPPISYEGNAMSYVIAYDEDGYAKDVTRRYARSFNAKTRKQRVESFPDGQRWLNKAMKPLKRREPTDRDQIEEAELSKKAAQEGLPSNIQDFKDHPHYALERHLKRNEVIWPKREVGKTTAGKAGTLEPIYRRSDVQIVQSADRWYRQGREVKAGEQPLKHVPGRTRRQKSPFSDDEEAEMAALYAHYQTEEYVPPPVVRGKVPKNVYGNIDVYVPTMIPAGASHIKHPLAKKAAQVLAIDYAEAVTGFQFKGRHGTAIVQGVVAASTHKEAVAATIQGFLEAQQQNEDEVRSAECLRLWRRFMLGLQIAERIGLSDIHAANDADQSKDFKEELDDAEDNHAGTVEAGGFFPDSGADNVAEPSAPRSDRQGAVAPNRPLMDEETALRSETARLVIIESPHTREVEKRNTPAKQVFKVSTDAQSQAEPNYDLARAAIGHFDGGFVQDATNSANSAIPPEDNEGGGFMPEDESGGGFLPEDDMSGGFLPDGGEDASHEVPQNLDVDDLFEDEVDQPYDPRGSETDGDKNDPSLGKAAGITELALPELQDFGNDEDAGQTSQTDGRRLSHLDKPTDSDEASLLSHDPDDEDADPDWLNG
ncbi:DNA repair protein rhp41-like protein [Elsinoe fawcettii]|nr:DNA repair protein rhp41-like protein [Elsinoe fawcettii]